MSGYEFLNDLTLLYKHHLSPLSSYLFANSLRSTLPINERGKSSTKMTKRGTRKAVAPIVTIWHLSEDRNRDIVLSYAEPPGPNDVWLYGNQPLSGNIIMLTLNRRSTPQPPQEIPIARVWLFTALGLGTLGLLGLARFKWLRWMGEA